MLKYIMALWKKVLIWLAVALALCLLVFYLFYYFISNIEFESAKHGQYDLVKITQTDSSQNEVTIEEFESGEYYITIDEEDVIHSYSQDKGIAPREDGYYYFLHGNEIIIFLTDEDGSVAYTGLYENDTIKITISSETSTTNYYYVFSSEPTPVQPTPDEPSSEQA